MVKKIGLLVQLSCFLILNSLTAQSDYYVLGDADMAKANGVYEKTGNLEIHGKDFNVFEGPLPEKRFQITPVEYQFPIYQWKVVDKTTNEVLFFTTETPHPNPPENEWVSNDFPNPKVMGPMNKEEAERRSTKE